MITMQEVHKAYDNGTRALKGVSLKIEDGEFAFLVGPSGSGKSTVIKILTGEVPPSEGIVEVNGYSLSRKLKSKKKAMMRRTLGIVFQDFRLIEKKSVYENVAFAMRVTGFREREIRRRVPYVLDLVGLNVDTDRRPDELSGGEQQRVAIARALVNNPATIIADEPTGNLDPLRSLEIMMLLEKINQLGTTTLVISHAKELVNRFDKRVISLDNGRVISDGMRGYVIHEKIEETAE